MEPVAVDPSEPGATEVLIVLRRAAGDAVQAAEQLIETSGGRLLQTYGTRVCVAEVPSTSVGHLAEDPLVLGLYPGTVPDELANALDETGRLGIAAWNARHETSFQQAKRARVGEGLPWDHPDFEREG